MGNGKNRSRNNKKSRRRNIKPNTTYWKNDNRRRETERKDRKDNDIFRIQMGGNAMSCGNIPKIIEINNDNRAKITNKIYNLGKCCGRETIEEMNEARITIKGGKWKNIQEAINEEYKMGENEEYQCDECKKKRKKEQME